MGTKENPEDTDQSSASSEEPQEGSSKHKVRTDLKVWLAQAPRGWNTSTQKRKSHDSDES